MPGRQSVTESVILAIRMIKWLVAGIVHLHERGRDVHSNFGAQTARKINKICAGLDIRQIDVRPVAKTAMAPRRGSKRQVEIRIVFGKTTGAVEEYIATGTCNLIYDEGTCWEPIKRVAHEALCWGVDCGRASVKFPDGQTEAGPEIYWADGTAELPPL